MLNRMCGTTAFHIWNVDEVPDVDVRKIMRAYQVKADVEGLD